ncbi:MAG: VWA domain-containing protein, partial [Candidatus Micrarchaeota archaeon]
IGFMLSPTHNVSITRTGTKEAFVRYYSKEIPDRDFQLFYGVTDRDYDVKAIANKRANEDGYYMLFIYPSSPEAETVSKDIVYVMDTSGSMSGSKIEQTKKALKYGLDRLGSDDRFSIITFSSEVVVYAGPYPADRASPLYGTEYAEDAKKFVSGLDASGATNIQDALVLASKQFTKDDGRMHLIVLLTDGEDTTGHSTRSIMDAIADCDCRIFPFGVGADIDFELLDRISNEHGDGLPTYIRLDSELESSLTIFYNKISRPLLHNVKVSVEGTGLSFTETYPKKVSDIFFGSQIVIVGKYSGFGSAKVKVTGTVSGKEKSFEYPISLPESDSNQFVERTWAARKLGYLLDTIALEGETPALKEQAVAIAKKYGLPSPYTSYVAVNDQGEKLRRDVGVNEAPGGWGIQGNSMTTAAAYKSAESYQYAPPQTKTVDDKTFVSVGGVWKDTTCGEKIDKKVEFGSGDYFSLAANSQVARYLSVGDSVQLCTDSSIMVVGAKTAGTGPGTGSEVGTGPATGTGIGSEIPGTGVSSGEGDLWSILMNMLPLTILLLFGIAATAYIIISRPHEFQARPQESESESQLYKALSSDTRIDILKVLEDGEGGRTPTFISEKLGKSKATISEHLDKLVESGLVDKEEAEGRKWVFYKLTSKGKSAIRKTPPQT